MGVAPIGAPAFGLTVEEVLQNLHPQELAETLDEYWNKLEAGKVRPEEWTVDVAATHVWRWVLGAKTSTGESFNLDEAMLTP